MGNVSSCQFCDKKGFHTVQENEYPGKIAKNHGVPYSLFARLNNINEKNARRIQIGSKLQIPQIDIKQDSTKKTEKSLYNGKQLYYLEANDNPSVVAEKFGVSRKRLMHANGWTERSAKTLQIGKPMVIPPKIVPLTDAEALKKDPKIKEKGNVINSLCDGKLKGKGYEIALTAVKYGVDPFIMAAIIFHETGYGTSDMLKNKNNPGGLKNRKGQFSKFFTLSSGFKAMALRLRENYVEFGQTSFVEIQKEYCPSNDPDDKDGKNQHWVDGTTRIYNKLLLQLK